MQLGHRSDSARKDGKMKQVLAPDTFQYVPDLETLKFLFQHEEMQNLFLQSKKSTDNKMHDYHDGAQFTDNI